MCIIVLFTIESSLSYSQQVIKRCRNHTEVHLASRAPSYNHNHAHFHLAFTAYFSVDAISRFKPLATGTWPLSHASRVTQKGWLNCLGCRRHRKTKEQRWLNSKILTSHPWLHEREKGRYRVVFLKSGTSHWTRGGISRTIWRRQLEVFFEVRRSSFHPHSEGGNKNKKTKQKGSLIRLAKCNKILCRVVFFELMVKIRYGIWRNRLCE